MGNLISIQLAAWPTTETNTPKDHCRRPQTLRLDYPTVMPQRTSFFSFSFIFMSHLGQKTLQQSSLHRPPSTTQCRREEKTHASVAHPNPAPLNLLLLLLLGLWGRRNVVLLGLGRGVTTTDLLPWRGGIVKVSKRLGELKGFVDDPLLFVIVSDLGVTLWSGSVSGVLE